MCFDVVNISFKCCFTACNNNVRIGSIQNQHTPSSAEKQRREIGGLHDHYQSMQTLASTGIGAADANSQCNVLHLRRIKFPALLSGDRVLLTQFPNSPQPVPKIIGGSLLHRQMVKESLS